MGRDRRHGVGRESEPAGHPLGGEPGPAFNGQQIAVGIVATPAEIGDGGVEFLVDHVGIHR